MIRPTRHPGASAGTNLGVDAIKEFKIVATTFSADDAGGRITTTATHNREIQFGLKFVF
jgi:hypothetical protein